MEEQKDLGSYSEGGSADAVSQNSTVGYTPGPLSFTGFIQDGSTSGHIYLTDANGRKIASLWGLGTEKVANAHLFSAAPDLLAALQGVSDMLMARPDIVAKLHPLMGFAEKATFDRARAAIAKALGS